MLVILAKLILTPSPFTFKPEFFNPFTLAYNYFFVPYTDYYAYYDTYDYTEFLIYALLPVLIWLLIRSKIELVDDKKEME